MSGVHVYGDESLRGGFFVMAAALVPSAQARDLRALILSLKKPDQVRIHFVSERDSRRRKIIRGFVDAKVEGLIIDATSFKDTKAARDAAVARLTDEAAKLGASRLYLEREESVGRSDKLIMRERLQLAGAADLVSYGHLRAADDCLLCVPDALAWCYGKGGDWWRLASPLVVDVIKL